MFQLFAGFIVFNVDEHRVGCPVCLLHFGSLAKLMSKVPSRQVDHVSWQGLFAERPKGNICGGVKPLKEAIPESQMNQ